MELEMPVLEPVSDPVCDLVPVPDLISKAGNKRNWG